MKKFLIMAAIFTAFFSFPAGAEYHLDILKGQFPENVRVENLSEATPSKQYYKNGWTDTGWTGGDFGTRRNVALAPSCMEDGKECRAAFTLPAISVARGAWLSWEACAVLPSREETYSVKIQVPASGDTWVDLMEAVEKGYGWHTRMVDLAPYEGLEVNIRFECSSSYGYMLALDNVAVTVPEAPDFRLLDPIPVMYGADGAVDGFVEASVQVLNAGCAVSEADWRCSVPGSSVEVAETAPWPTGETRVLSIRMPLELNRETPCSLTLDVDGHETLTLHEGVVYCTSFRRNMLVDKGTGMWCNNCPAGTVALREFRSVYGDAVLTAETHNGDILANDIYFSWLGFRSIPRLTINHIRASGGETADYFANYIFSPTEIGLRITDISSSASALTVKAEVQTSATFSDSDRLFRVAYVLTRNVNGADNFRCYQENICSLPRYEEYYFLPSRIPAAFCVFPDVTVPNQLASSSADPAFTGIEGSLPESLAPDACYNVEWEIPLPEGYESFEGMRLVAMVVDAGSRAVINSTAAETDDYAGIETVAPADFPGGAVSGIFTLDGRRVDASFDTLPPGIYVAGGRKIVKTRK